MQLEIGHKHNFVIRKEIYATSTGIDCKVVYLSDLHLNGKSAIVVRHIIESVTHLNPDIVLLGGDYIDTLSGLKHLELLLFYLSSCAQVFAVAGNHDFWCKKLIKRVMALHKVHWLEKISAVIAFGDKHIQINGNNWLPPHAKVDVSIVCLHKPSGNKKNIEKHNIVCAGHLHGCQFVFWQSLSGLYPGRLVYKWNIVKKYFAQTLYVVSKGLGDTLPIRLNCPKDIIFIHITHKPTLK